MNQSDRASAFHALHRVEPPRAFMLPNAWDALSARAMEEAGAVAIGTTSAGMAWALGAADGERVSRSTMIDAIRRVVDAVRVPVTADIESGYGRGTPDDVAETVRAVIGAGAIGINLEDTPGEGDDPLIPISRQADRLAAAVAAARAEAVGLFINARVDTYLLQVGDPSARLDLTIDRGQAYVEAGADGLFVPGVSDPDVIGHLASAMDVPLNIMAVPGAPDVAALSRLGVRRVSVGPGIALRVLGVIADVTESLATSGSFDSLRGGWGFGTANAWFRR